MNFEKLNYNIKSFDNGFFNAGTALLVLRGSPGARGLTIDTAAEPGDNPVIDEWGKSDVRFLSTIFLATEFRFVL